MPQASLLDFFKSKTPSPFPPATAANIGSNIQLEVETSGASSNNAINDENESKQRNGDAPSQEVHAYFTTGQKNVGSIQNTSQTLTSRLVAEISGLSIGRVKIDHLPALKRLTGNLLPVRYPEAFFTGAVEDPVPASFSRVATIDENPIGWIRCRLDPFPEPTVPPSKTKPIYNQLYIQALCILGPYRGLGIARALLDDVLYEPNLREHDISTVYAHVWESNGDGLVWYDRQGFRQVIKVDEYYRKLRPNGAWIVKKDLSYGLSLDL